MGNHILIVITFIVFGCSTNNNKYSNVSEKENYGVLDYSFKEDDFVDVSNLMINQSIPGFIIATGFRVLTINVLKKMNSLNDLNKEKHLKAIYIAVNYLDVGKASIWTDKKSTIKGKVYVLRRFYLDNNQCVSYKEIIKKKTKKNLEYKTACNINNQWVIQNV